MPSEDASIIQKLTPSIFSILKLLWMLFITLTKMNKLSQIIDKGLTIKLLFK